jgi:hypothetical protein
MPDPPPINTDTIQNIANIGRCIGIGSKQGNNLDLNGSIIITQNTENAVDNNINKNSTPGTVQNSVTRRSLFIKEVTDEKYTKLSCKNSEYPATNPNHSNDNPTIPTLIVNDSEVVTTANIASVANNIVDGSANTRMINTSDNSKITIQTNGGGNSSDIEIISCRNITLSSQNNILFKIDDDKTIVIHNEDKGSDLFKFTELNSTNQGGNKTDLTLNHIDVGTFKTTGYFNLSVGDKGTTTIKTVDSNTESADLKVQVEGSINFYDREGVDDDNKILTIECANATTYGLHLNRSLYLSYKKHIPDDNWTVTYKIPTINTHSTHYFFINTDKDRFGVISNGIQDGQILHLFFDNSIFENKTLKLKFSEGNDKKLVGGGGKTNCLTFSQSGQSAYLLWIESKWRIVNTGAALSNT